ncbi:hypothetical protein ACWEIJ_14430 [Lentzea sp. NPDC004789]
MPVQYGRQRGPVAARCRCTTPDQCRARDGHIAITTEAARRRCTTPDQCRARDGHTAITAEAARRPAPPLPGHLAITTEADGRPVPVQYRTAYWH